MKSGIKNLILILAASFCVTVTHGQDALQLYHTANTFYKDNQYQQAAANYEKILSLGFKNSDVYYNLGNCYYKSDSIGKSILNYERALKYSPDDEDIIHNLRLARMKCVDRIQPVPQLAIINWWNNFTSFNNSNGWGYYSLGSIWLAIVIFAISFFTGKKKLLNWLLFFSALSSIIFLSLAYNQKSKEKNTYDAILMIPSLYVKSAPDKNSADLFIIHEGVKIHLLDPVGNWNKIRLADGKVGWIERGSFEKI